MSLRLLSLRLSRASITAAALSTLLWTTACVIPNTEEKREQLAETHDPFEPMNRYFFEVNLFLQEFVLKPATGMYQAALPTAAQNGVHKFLANLHLPWTAVNDVLQGNPGRAGVALTRFAINTTVGGVGLFDVATGWGFPDHEEDFGQTLAVWGVPEMFYLVLPFFGPSNPRDTVGTVAGWYFDPVNFTVTNYVPKGNRVREPPNSEYRWFPTVRGGLEAIDLQAREGEAIDELKKQSMDFYATIRSVWRQRRAALIENRGENEPEFPAPRTSLVPADAVLLAPLSEPQAPAAPRRAGFALPRPQTATSE